MTKRFNSITDAEMTVMKTLWAGEQTARTVAQSIYGRSDETEIGTVHSLLLRLERKGLVGRDRSQTPHRFAARVSQVDLAGLQLEAMAEKLSDGSLAPFISHLFHAKKLSSEEIAEIRQLLQEPNGDEKWTP